MNKQLLHKSLPAIISAIVGFIIIWCLTTIRGVGISPDSIAYTGVARTLLVTHHLNTYNKSPLTDFPAFYPLYLAGVMLVTQHDILLVAPVFNAILFALTIFISSKLISDTSTILKWITTLLIACSISLVPVYYMLWSETLFILLAVIFFVAIHRYLSSLKIAHLVIAAFIAALCSITRYAGITVIGTGGFLLLFQPKLRPAKKIVRLIVFGFVSSSLLAINLIRNFLLVGNLTGGRVKSITPLTDNIYFFGKVITNWLLSTNLSWAITVILIIIVLACFAYLFITNIFKTSLYYSYQNILVAFFLVYSVFIIASATLSRYDTIDNRLLSPLFIPFTIVICSGIKKAIEKSKQKWISFLAILAATCFAAEEIVAIPKVAQQKYFNSNDWQHAETVTFLKAHMNMFKSDYTVYSNANAAFYLFTGHSADPIPSKNNAQEVADFYEEDNVYVVWFNNVSNNFYLSLKDITAHKKLTLIKQCKDGSIYVCNENADQ